MSFRPLLPALLLAFALSACGDDGPGAGPDADPGPGACAALGAIATSLDSYPATFSGTVIGGGADLHVAEGVCTEEAFFDPTGEDIVVALTNLTAGTAYGVVLASEVDLGFYVLTDCGAIATGEVTGGCPLFEDGTLTGESNDFVAPASGTVWLVIDNGDDAATAGDFELLVRESECAEDAECSGASPICVDFGCVECRDNFDCTAAGAGVCTDNACGAGSNTCTGDDAIDTTGAGDDGPADATEITLPTGTTVTSVTGAICSSPASERDFMKVVVPATERYGFTLDFDGTADLDLIILDEAGDLVDLGINDGLGLVEAFATELDAGTYYLEVQMFAPGNAAAAVSYTLGMFVAECETDFECTTSAEPVCGPAGTCTVGTSQCTGDDTIGDPAVGGTSDDGPGGATLLVSGVQASASICNVPDTEADYFEMVVAAGEGVTASLAWVGATIDLDLAIFDEQGTVHGISFWKNPEVVTLTYLPAGTYYFRVVMFAATDVPAAAPYTLTVTRTADLTCASPADCAATYSTQIYRGRCGNDGSCDFIPAAMGAANAACDSTDDCTSGICSYIAFESDAQKSVCTDDCTTTADCTAVGTGLTCSTGLATNRCLPSCAADLECGASTNSMTVTAGEPWDYFTCTTATNSCSLQ